MTVSRSVRFTACALLFAASVPGCRRPEAATREADPSTSTRALSAPAASPDSRSMSVAELDATVLWLSDIAIRHVGVDFPLVSFNYSGWQTAADLTARTEQEALARAEEVVRRAQAGEPFESLAREYSDEPERSSRGGSLGGVTASHLTPWPQVLDAVLALQPGQVTNVIETDTGYHVLLRRAPPPEAVVSGRHLVIAHDSAPWFAKAAMGPIPERTREQALELARGLYHRALAQPGELGRLIDEHSEHRDRVRGGDFGTWSTLEPTDFPREVETLSRLRVGEIAEPIDSAWGIQIIQRVDDPSRERLAMATIDLIYDPGRPAVEPGSRQWARREIDALGAALRRQPEQFAALQQQYCCPGAVEVIAGRHSPAVESTLARLAQGQIAEQPIEELNLRFRIVKRLGLEELSAR